ncbi:MAG: aromatic ring-hydroxylating dioxygenase subunit alpha [Pseudomonadota bacterium]
MLGDGMMVRLSPLNQQFFDSLVTSVGDLADAETLPPECYVDREFYEFEKEAVFGHEWLCVGREEWVKNRGDFFNTIIADEPIVVTRGKDGEIRAMSSVCQHRAMLVSEGRGNTKAFVCPYHHWTFALDGRLINAPAMNKTCNFHKEDHSLPSFKVEIWQGFIFINFDHDAEPLAPRLTEIDEVVDRYDMATGEEIEFTPAFDFPWNWKVMFENNNDGYHASRLHQGPLHDFVPSDRCHFPEVSPESAGYYRTNQTLHSDASFNATQKALLPIFPRLTDEDRNQMVFANIPPTLSLVMMSDSVIYLIVRATGPERNEMDVGVLAAPGASKVEGFTQRMGMNGAAAAEIMAQDQHVDEMVQVGLRSRFAKRGRYSWQEGAQLALNQWLVPRYKQTWETHKSQLMRGRAQLEQV